MEYPAIIVAIIRLRIPSGEYSLINPMTFGIIPPNPKPVMNRNSPNISGLGANPARSINRLKLETQIRTSFFFLIYLPKFQILTPQTSFQIRHNFHTFLPEQQKFPIPPLA